MTSMDVGMLGEHPFELRDVELFGIGCASCILK
jgi:hypothetical protein